MKNKYDEAVSEAFLKSAFEEAAAQELAELDEMDIEIEPPTDKQRREIERELRKLERKGSAWGWVKRTAAIIAIVVSLSFGLLMTQQDVRASVFDAIVSFFEKYVVFAFADSEPRADYVIGDYKITYVPEGYYLENQHNNPAKTELSFSNGENDIYVYFYQTPFNETSADSKRVVVNAVEMGDMKGCFMEYDGFDYNELVWGDDSYTFKIKSPISKEEIIKIAKNIK